MKSQFLKCLTISTLPLVLLLGWLGGSCQVYAATSLNIESPHGLQGTVIQAGISVTTDTPLAGFNSEIILPAGVSFHTVQLGDLQRPGGQKNSRH